MMHYSVFRWKIAETPHVASPQVTMYCWPKQHFFCGFGPRRVVSRNAPCALFTLQTAGQSMIYHQANLTRLQRVLRGCKESERLLERALLAQCGSFPCFFCGFLAMWVDGHCTDVSRTSQFLSVTYRESPYK